MTRLFGPEWGELCAGHSRHWAKRCGRPVSRLCFADKLAFVLTPDWLYLLMTRATGELYEYMQKSATGRQVRLALRPRNRPASPPPTPRPG